MFIETRSVAPFMTLNDGAAKAQYPAAVSRQKTIKSVSKKLTKWVRQ